MEHARSTLATATVLLTGLVVASHVLYPADSRSDAPIRPTPVASDAQAWTDPPARPQPRALPPLTEAALVPAPEAILAADVPLKPVRTAAIQAEPARKAELLRRRRMAQAAVARARPANPAETADVAATAAPAPPASRIDPIGDIMRGLGFGGQG